MIVDGESVRRSSSSDLKSRLLVAAGVNPGDASGRRSTRTTLVKAAVALGLDIGRDVSEARITETLFAHVGLVYDPTWDTTEAAVGPDRATVTERGLSRLICALTGTPRCFILKYSDSGAGVLWERDHERRYRYNSNVTSYLGITQAGPGSRVIYYATGRAAEHKFSFVASATIEYIEELDGDPDEPTLWEAAIADYLPFQAPVSRDRFSMPKWNNQHAIVEITPATFDALVRAGTGDSGRTTVPGSGVAGLWAELMPDRSGPHVERAVLNLPSDPNLITPLDAPQEMPKGELALDASSRDERVRERQSDGSDSPLVVASLEGKLGSTSTSYRDGVAEQRAIEITRVALEASGWRLVRDCQADGVGYDLEFLRDEQALKVEVKGIQGRDLIFNMTPKELRVASLDERWVLVAVTSVLSPADFKPVLLTRDVVCAAPRKVLGYRVSVT